jgi:cation diffusion facilitator CzcD-associated flavoprotein CzcO
MTISTDLLIIGAGPFGLAMAAYADDHQLDYRIVGRWMEFWQANMPKSMLLRSACDWHLDPGDVHTIEHYLETQSLTPAAVEPLSLDFYLGYVRWFRAQKQIEPMPTFVQRLEHRAETALFQATLDHGQTIQAKKVVVAIGFKPFKNVPAEIAALIPETHRAHTCDFVDLSSVAGKRCAIIGGRQSAFEWAALLHEQGAVAVHVVHRHDTPQFTPSDWSWVNTLVDAMADDPGWFRNLSPQEKKELNHRFWVEGRQKLEPWLEPRIRQESISLWPNANVIACRQLADNSLKLDLDVGEAIIADQVILATGYKVDVNNIPFLAGSNLLAKLATKNGYPALDMQFQSNIPGLFFTSMCATQDFGAFFAFTVSVRTSARVIGAALRKVT